MKGIHFFFSPLVRKFPQWSFWNRIEPPVIEGPLGLKAQFPLGWRSYKQWEVNGDIRCISASRYSTAEERMSLGALPQKQFFRKTTVVLPDNVDSEKLAEALLTEMRHSPDLKALKTKYLSVDVNVKLAGLDAARIHTRQTDMAQMDIIEIWTIYKQMLLHAAIAALSGETFENDVALYERFVETIKR